RRNAVAGRGGRADLPAAAGRGGAPAAVVVVRGRAASGRAQPGHHRVDPLSLDTCPVGLRRSSEVWREAAHTVRALRTFSGDRLDAPSPRCKFGSTQRSADGGSSRDRETRGGPNRGEARGGWP